MSNKEELLVKARLLPLAPGVYLMKNAGGKVIYVGKSKLLKNRVSSYFAPYTKHNAKTRKMVSLVDDFEVFHTASELEALVLECKLIKQYMPKYNIKLKDSSAYPYIRITSEEYPRMTIVYSRGNDKDKYFGPYSSVVAAKNIADTVKRTFMLPLCNKHFPEDINKSGRPCLNYHIKRCYAPCIGAVSREEYNELVIGAAHLLKGDYNKIVEQLKEKMDAAADELQFEKAAKYRDSINAIKRTGEKQHIITKPDTDADVFGVYTDDLGGAVNALFIRNGAISDKESFFFSNDEIINSESLISFFQRFYLLREYIPKEIWVDFPLEQEDKQLFVDWVSAQFPEKFEKSVILVPQKGEKKSIAVQSSVNARELILHKRKQEEKQNDFLLSLAQLLCLPLVPSRIEAYDISNSGDENITAGMIVLEDGKFKKSDYRSFNISLSSADDYGSLREALTRRIEHAYGENKENWVLPDLFLIDGGEQHVAAAKSVLAQYGLELPVFGMVKDEFHKTRTLTDGDREISLIKRQDVFTFIYKIQEEVHRYSIRRMDIRRRKAVKTSLLEDIKGVGQKKALLLLSEFGGLAKIKEASEEQLAAVKGVDKKTAKAVYEFFKENNK